MTGGLGGLGDNEDIEIDTDRKHDKSEEPSMFAGGIRQKWYIIIVNSLI